jgi:hypothetical protein
VNGLDTFKQHFKDDSESYIVIGGAACEEHFESMGMTFRATKDIDMILVVEGMNADFVTRFWTFIKEGVYERKERSEGRQFYRFMNPENANFPDQLELFCRVPDGITSSEGGRFTIIPTEEDISSLSAILMDDNYYHFTRQNCINENDLNRANKIALVCLKAKAFLDLTQWKDDGHHIDTKTINKHRSDVFRLAATFTGDDKIDLPASIRTDMSAFIKLMDAGPPQTKEILKLMGIANLSTGQLIAQLKESFGVKAE